MPAALLALAVLASCAGSSSTPAPQTFDALEAVRGTATSVDGIPVVFTTRGEGTEAVVLVHGWCSDRTLWDGTAADLATTYRVVTLDLAGHGESGSNRADWSMASFGEDVRSVVDLLGLDRVILVGHSMGGPVVLEAARLLGDRVVGVVAVEALHDVDRPYDQGEWNAFLEMYRTDFRETCSRFVISMFAEGTDPELMLRTGEAMCEGVNEELAIRLLELFPSYDRAAALASTRVPVRSINGSIVPTDWRGNQRVDPDFAVVILEDAGHFPMLEVPEQFRRTLREVLAELVAGAASA